MEEKVERGVDGARRLGCSLACTRGVQTTWFWVGRLKGAGLQAEFFYQRSVGDKANPPCSWR